MASVDSNKFSSGTGTTDNIRKGAGTGGGQTTRIRALLYHNRGSLKQRQEMKVIPTLEAAEIKYHQSFSFPTYRSHQETFYLQRVTQKNVKCMGKNMLKSFCVKYLLP